ncbi:unnamed protein product, partial [Amoebophrya sp. A120]|eukprot:GSA120T00005302001.1
MKRRREHDGEPGLHESPLDLIHPSGFRIVWRNGRCQSLKRIDLPSHVVSVILA